MLVNEEGRVKVRGLRLPSPSDVDELRRVDLEAVINLAAALAPASEHPLREMALAWRGTDKPESVAAIVLALLTVPDDADTEALVDPTPTPATGVPKPRRNQSALIVIALVTMALVALAITVFLPGRGSPGSVSGPLGPVTVARDIVRSRGQPADGERSHRGKRGRRQPRHNVVDRALPLGQLRQLERRRRARPSRRRGGRV